MTSNSSDKYCDKYCDIYCLKKNKFGLLNNKKCIPDFSNIIFLKTKLCKQLISHNLLQSNNLSEELICSNCDKETIYLHDTSKGMLCPLCSYNNFGHKKSCLSCYKQIGCESCGGKSSKMFEINMSQCFRGMISLCAQDKCLMPFGHCIKTKRCSCLLYTFYNMKNKFCSDMYNELKDILLSRIDISNLDIFNYNKSLNIFRETKFADLSLSNNNKCLNCQISNKYKKIDKCSMNGEELICNCH
jgi:hypothetical protein